MDPFDSVCFIVQTSTRRDTLGISSGRRDIVANVRVVSHFLFRKSIAIVKLEIAEGK